MKVLVVGDIMLDQYTFARTERRAEEANIPVWDEVRNEYRLGGAANTAHNLKAIGKEEVEVHLAGMCGSAVVSHLLDGAGILRDRVMGGSTMTKRRFVDETQKYVMRLDNFRRFDPAEVDFFEMMMDYWPQSFDAAIISDYDKGTITEKIVKLVRNVSGFVVVDSKREDLRVFEGTNVLKVNESEHGAQSSSKLYTNFTKFFEYVVVTRGKDGADLLQCEQVKSTDKRYIIHRENFPADKVTAKDVTGCGDTHTAAMTFALLKNREIRNAVRFANQCAGKVVQQFGTSVV